MTPRFFNLTAAALLAGAASAAVFTPATGGAGDPAAGMLIGTFPAEAGRVYTLTATIAAAGDAAPVTLQILWRDARGNDAGREDALLGRAVTVPAAAAPAGWAGNPLPVRLTGRAALAGTVTGELRASGAKITVGEVKIIDGTGDEPAPAPAVDPGKIIAQGDGEFAKNLLPENWRDWRREGAGETRVEAPGYGGLGESLVLGKDDQECRLLSPPAPVDPALPVWWSLRVKFNRVAVLHGFPPPAEVEFLRADGAGWATVPGEKRRFYFDAGSMLTDFYGDWLALFGGPLPVPPGATHARLAVSYRDVRKFWDAVPRVANALPLRLAQPLLWQAPAPAAPPVAWSALPPAYRAPLAAPAKPPFFPVSDARENSVVLFTLPTPTSGLFFPETDAAPRLAAGLANLLPVAQKITVTGRVTDAAGRAAGTLTKTLPVAPWAVTEVTFDLAPPEKFGAYYVDFQITAGGRPVGGGHSRFAWLRQNTVPAAVRHDAAYPFDMHPGDGIAADAESVFNPADCEAQARIMQLLGVRAARIQSRFTGLDYNSRERSAAGAREKVERWKNTVWPVLQRHGIEVWISMMEQGRGVVPRAPAQREIFAEYIREQTRAFGGIPLFYLFGNEGVGGAISEDYDAHLWTFTPAGDFTTREWMAAYRAAHDAVKAAGGDKTLVGPAQASDPGAKVARAFNALLPGDAGRADLWGYNCYGNTAAQGRGIFEVLAAGGHAPAFGVVPETGINATFWGDRRVPEEQRQATGMVKTYVTTLADGLVKRVTWFILTGGRGNETLNIFDADRTPRPAAAAYLTMTDTLRAGRVEQRLTLDGGGEFFIWRRTDGTVVGVGWAESEKNITLDTGGAGAVELSDIYGNRERKETRAGTVSVRLTPEPVYVLGAAALAESTALQVAVRNASGAAGRAVAVTARNNTGAAQTLTIANRSHPTVAVSPAQKIVTVPAGGAVTETFAVNLLNPDERRRSRVGFHVSNSGDLDAEARLADTFARCVYAARPPATDGTWAGWEGAELLRADRRDQVEEPASGRWQGPEDLSAVIRTLWDEKNFYVGVEVTDDVFCNEQPPERMFLGDAIEIGVEPAHRLTEDATLWQFVAGRGAAGAAMVKYLPPPGPVARPAPTVKTTGNKTVYQVAIPWSEFGDLAPAAGRQIGFGLIIDDGDGQPNDRKFISWFGAGVHRKKTGELGDLILVK